MKPHRRIWEIDFARGFAILLMILFHLIVDLKDFYSFPVDYLSGPWYLEGKLSAILFIFLAGISCVLSQKTTIHGINVLGWGLLLTFITYYYNSYMYIRFGILHLLGISILSYKFINRMSANQSVILCLFSLLAGTKTTDIRIPTSYLLPLGITPPDFQSMDYYPLFPWYGVFLLGVLIGKKLYSTRRSLFSVSMRPTVLNYLGQHSLIIYLIHQPILLAILHLLYRFYH